MACIHDQIDKLDSVQGKELLEFYAINLDKGYSDKKATQEAIKMMANETSIERNELSDLVAEFGGNIKKRKLKFKDSVTTPVQDTPKKESTGDILTKDNLTDILNRVRSISFDKIPTNKLKKLRNSIISNLEVLSFKNKDKVSDESLFALNTKLNELSTGIKVITPTDASVRKLKSKEQIGNHTQEETTGNMATDITRDGLTNSVPAKGETKNVNDGTRDTLSTNIQAKLDKNGEPVNISILSTVNNFFSRLNTKEVQEELSELNEAQASALEPLSKFNNIFYKTLIESSIKYFTQNLIYKNNLDGDTKDNGDPFGYLIQVDSNGNRYLNQNLNTVMAMTMFNWVATQGRSTLHNNRGAINAILGLDEEAIPSDAARNALTYAGSARTDLAETLGNLAWKLTGLEGKEGIDGRYEDRLKLSIGEAMITTLLEMNVLEQKSFTATEMSALVGTGTTSVNPNSASNFIRLRGKIDSETNFIVPNAASQKIIDINDSSDGVIKELFDINSHKTEPTYTKPIKVSKFLKNTQELMKAPEKLRKRVKKLQEVKWRIKTNVFDVLDLLGTELTLDMMGYNRNLKDVHITQEKSEIAKNEALLRELDDAYNFYDTNKSNLTKPFYFVHEVWRNLRVGMVSNTVNPQAKKSHRNLFGIQNHNVTIKNETQRNVFKLAVSLAFGYSVDKNTEQSAHDRFDQLLENEVIQKGITAIKEGKSGNKQDILAAVELGGGGMHSLDGLVALRAYSPSENFETNLGVETDGITNGVIIGLLQSMSEPDMVSVLNPGGVFFSAEFRDSGDWKSSDPTNFDSYERLGVLWNRELKSLELDSDTTSFIKSIFSPIAELNEAKELIITEEGRKLSKNPLMTTNYGAGIKKIIKLLEETALTNFYSKLMEISKSENAQLELDKFIKDFNTAIHPGGAINALAIDIPSLSNIRDFKLPIKAENAFKGLIADTYGKALRSSLSAQFPGVTQYRKIINNSFKTMFYAFDTIFKQNVKIAEETKSEKAGKDITLTKEEKTKIISDLLELAPTIKTALSEGVEDSIFVMKQEKIRTYKNKSNSISQKSAKPIRNTKTVTGNNIGGKATSIVGTISEIILKEGGVAGLILAIQSTDSAIISDVYDKFDVLNIFDAQQNSINGIVAGTELYNKSMFDTNKEHSIIKEVKESLKRILTEASKDKDTYRIITNLVSQDKLLKGEFDKYNSPRDVFNDLSRIEKDIQESRDFWFPQMVFMSQSSFPNTGYPIQPDALLNNEISSFLKEEDSSTKAKTKTLEENIKETLKEVTDDILNKNDKGSSPNEIDFDNFNATYQDNLTGDNSVRIFDDFANEGNVIETVERQESLKELLTSLVNKVISPLDSTPLKLDVQLNQEGDSVFGAIRDTDIRIQAGQGVIGNSNQISAQETLVHELIHAISDYGLGKEGKFVGRLQLQKLFNQVKDNITIEDFLNRDAQGNIIIHTDVKSEYIAAKNRYDYIFNNQDGNGLAEFMAFGLTNEIFGKALSNIQATPKRDLKSGSILDRLKELYELLLDFISGRIFSITNLNADKALLKLTQEIVGINDTNNKTLFKYLDIINEVNPIIISKLDELIFSPLKNYYQYLKENDATLNKAQRTARTVLGVPILAKEAAFSNTVTQVLRAIKITEDNMLVNLAREVVGVTVNTFEWHKLLRFSKKYIDQARKHIATNVTKDLQEYFEDGFTKDESIALNKILLKLDISSITDKYTFNEISELLSDNKKLNKAIEDTVAELDVYGNNGNYYIRQANSLGYFIVNGQVLEKGDALLNAYNIATMNYVPNKTTGNITKAEEIIDRLATLYGISYSTKVHRDSIANMINKEFKRNKAINGIIHTNNVHKQFKRESLDKLFQGKKHSVVKGYTSEILNPAIDIKIGTANDVGIMEEAGYYPEAELSYDEYDPKNRRNEKGEETVLYISKTGLLNAQVKTTASLTNRTSKGATLFDEYVDAEKVMSSTDALEALHKMQLDKAKDVQDQFRSRTLPTIKGRNNIAVPIVNDKGEITDYRYLMSERVKDTLLEKNNRFDIVMGKMFGSITDKVNSAKINKSVIDLAKQDYDDNFSKEPAKFVRISADSVNKRYRDIWILMPKEMKQDMRESWGRDEILVREELINLIFGYRKIGLTDNKLIQTFTHSNVGRLMRADMYMRLTGQIWQEVVAIAKDNIVIKSWVVLKDNVISNNFLLWVKGVPIKNIFVNQAIALKALDLYQKELDVRDKLQRRLDTDKTLTSKNKAIIKSKIETLNTSLVSNPVSELIDEGIFQNIVEDIDLEEKSFSLKTKLVDKFKDKTEGYVPDVATEVYKQAYLTKDTFIYKQLLKGTQYSDFVARFTLYQHLTKNKNVPKQEAISEIVETFINYDVPTSPELQYLNDMGVLMFTKFLFRIQRVIVRIIKENPANALALQSLQTAFGNIPDITDSAALLNSSLIHRIQNTLFNVPDKATYMGGIELAKKAFDPFDPF